MAPGLPKLSSFLLGVRELDQGHQNLLDDPRPLILVLGKNLDRNQADATLYVVKLTLRIRDKASSLKPLIALLPRVFKITVSFFALQSPFAPGSTTKKGPMAIYTA